MSPGAMHSTQLAIRLACGLKTDYEISLNWLGARCVVSAMAKKRQDHRTEASCCEFG